jgi:uncharacterized membrane protein
MKNDHSEIKQPLEPQTGKPPKKGVKTQEQRDFDEALHKLLIYGLALSVVLILTGLVLSIIEHQPLPLKVPSLSGIIANLLAFKASGFLNMGLLVLIATPVIRVFTSFIAFLFERDWRFALFTLIVLVDVIIGVVLGSY